MELIPYCANCKVRTKLEKLTSQCVKIVCPECLAFAIVESTMIGKPAEVLTHSMDARFVLFLEEE